MGVRSAARWIKNRLKPGALILLYHRVTELPRDPYALAVTPERFDDHLEVLARRARLVPMTELAKRLAEGQVEPRTVAITFDDGYLDNFEQALPILTKHGVPATVFVASGYVGKDREFWWDELDRVVLEPKVVPPVLELSIGGKPHSFELGNAGQEDVSGRPVRWKDDPDHPDHPRHVLFKALWRLLRTVEHAERQRALDALLAWSGAEARLRASHQIMSADQVRTLDAGGVIEVGAHTVTHPVLSSLPADAQRTEIVEGRAQLEAILGHRVAGFAYPFGRSSDYDQDSVAAAKEAGFAFACTTHSAVVRRKASLHELPRASPRNFRGEQFERWLDRYLPA
jgi:peptidoglycan/xylan/chitin deacetylase (PgdA/CDA1 family)